MFSGKAKELQRQLEEREQEIRELRGRVAEYQSRNDAVVSALTDAKAVAARIAAEAEEKSRAIIAESESLRTAASAERDALLNRAEDEARAIVSGADAQAREKLAKAQSEADVILRRAAENAKATEARAQEMKSYILSAAEDARRHAEGYASFLGGLAKERADFGPETEERLQQVEEVEEITGESPAVLMRSIYAMEGRELPDTAGGEEDRVWTVDEVLDGPAEFSPQSGAQTGVPSLDDELNDIINDILELD